MAFSDTTLLLASRQGNVNMGFFLRLLTLNLERTYWYHSHVVTQYCDGLVYVILDCLLSRSDI
jgi:hypothetical protein